MDTLNLQKQKSPQGDLLAPFSWSERLPQFKKELEEIGMQTDSTPLVTAILSNNVEWVKEILQSDCRDINTLDRLGVSPLGYAVRMIDGDNIVRTLVMHESCDLNIKDPVIGKTALMVAAEENKSEIAKILLLSKKIDPNLKSDVGNYTALMMAVMYKSLDVIKILLDDPRVDVNITEVTDFPPLMSAVQDNELEIVKIFLENKRVDINAVDKEGVTALMSATIFQHKEIIKKLIEAGADVNLVSNHGVYVGFTALMIAVYDGDIEVVKSLLTAKDINLNICNEFGKTALMIAVANNCPLIIKELLANSTINPNIMGGLPSEPRS